MRPRRPAFDVASDVSEMDPWKDDRCRDFVVLNTIQRLRAYHCDAEAAMPPVEPVNALRARNLLMLPRPQPDWRPCMGEARPLKRAERRPQARASQRTRLEDDGGGCSPPAASSSSISSDTDENEEERRGAHRAADQDIPYCALDRARTIFFGPQSFTSSTSPRNLLYSPHVPITPTPSASDAPAMDGSAPNVLGTPQLSGREQLLDSFTMQDGTPLRPPPPMPRRGTSAFTEEDTATPSRRLRDVDGDKKGAEEASPQPILKSTKDIPTPRFSCEVVDALVAYYQALLTRGVVLDRLNHKELGFAWWVVGRNMDTALLEQPHGPLRREAILIMVRNFYYSLLTSNRKRGEVAKTKTDEYAAAEGPKEERVGGEEEEPIGPTSGGRGSRRSDLRRPREEDDDLRPPSSAAADEPPSAYRAAPPAPRRRRAALEKAKSVLDRQGSKTEHPPQPHLSENAVEASSIVKEEVDPVDAVPYMGLPAAHEPQRPSARASRYVKLAERQRVMESTWKPQRVSRRIAAQISASEEDTITEPPVLDMAASAAQPPPLPSSVTPSTTLPASTAVVVAHAAPKSSSTRQRFKASDGPPAEPSFTRSRKHQPTVSSHTKVKTAVNEAKSATTESKTVAGSAVHTVTGSILPLQAAASKTTKRGGGSSTVPKSEPMTASVQATASAESKEAKICSTPAAVVVASPLGFAPIPNQTAVDAAAPVKSLIFNCLPTAAECEVEARIQRRLHTAAMGSYAFLLTSPTHLGVGGLPPAVASAVEPAPPVTAAKRGHRPPPPHIVGAVDEVLLPIMTRRNDAKELERIIQRRLQQPPPQDASPRTAVGAASSAPPPLLPDPPTVKMEDLEPDRSQTVPVLPGLSPPPAAPRTRTALERQPFHTLAYGQQSLLVWEVAGLLDAHQQRRRAAEQRRLRKAANRIVTRRMAALAARGDLQEILNDISTASSSTTPSSSSSSEASEVEEDTGNRATGGSAALGGSDSSPRRPRQKLNYFAKLA